MDNQKGIDLIIPVILPDSLCPKRRFAKEQTEEPFKFKRLENWKFEPPVKPPALMKKFPLKKVVEKDNFKIKVDDFTNQLSIMQDRDVEPIIYSEKEKKSKDKTTTGSSSIGSNNESVTDENKEINEYQIKAENMSYILIQVKAHMSNSGKFTRELSASALDTVESRETMRPHIVMGMIFTDEKTKFPVLTKMKRPSDFIEAPSALVFNVINPHLSLKNQAVSNGLQSLLEIYRGPLHLVSDLNLKDESFEIINQFPLEYCTNVDYFI
jgi:hypothetical protein